MSLVTVLYEDQMGASANGKFAVHEWILRCVIDETERPHHELRVQGNARKGVDNVLKDLRDDAAHIAGRGRLFVLIDRDRAVDHANRTMKLGLSRDIDDASLAEKIRAASNAPDRVEIFFLQQNMEGLLKTLRDCDDEKKLPEGALSKAIAKKDLLARNAVFAEGRNEKHGTLRTCVRAKQPGVGALVRAISDWVKANG